MAKRHILIYFQDNRPGADTSWLVLDQNMRPGPVYKGDLKTAANHASGCRVVVMVPGEEILLTNIDIPNMNRQRLMKAVPYALEESLASDLEDLHIAPGTRGEDNRLNVAVVERGRLENWVNSLRDANINPDALLPAVLLQKPQIATWYVVMEGEQADSRIMLRKESGGISLERQNLESLLTLAIEQCPEPQRPHRLVFVQLNSESSSEDAVLEPVFDPDDTETVIRQTQSETYISTGEDNPVYESELTLPINNGIEAVDATEAIQALENKEEPDNSATIIGAYEESLPVSHGDISRITPAIRELCETYSIDLEYRQEDQDSLVYFAEQGLDPLEVNLLQGEFSRKEQLERLFRPWIPAAAVAACWLIIQAGLLLGNYIEMSNKEAELIQRMDEVFADAFPEAKKTKFHLQDMKNRVANLKKGDTKLGGFFPLLHKTGKVLKDSRTANVTTMRYKNEKIDITMEISDLQALDKLKEKLSSDEQLKVEILTATSQNGKVNSRIQVELQG